MRNNKLITLFVLVVFSISANFAMVKEMTSEEAYKVLRLPENANHAEIKTAYYIETALNHPDNRGGYDHNRDEAKERYNGQTARKKYTDVSKAFQTLLPTVFRGIKDPRILFQEFEKKYKVNLSQSFNSYQSINYITQKRDFYYARFIENQVIDKIGVPYSISSTEKVREIFYADGVKEIKLIDSKHGATFQFVVQNDGLKYFQSLNEAYERACFRRNMLFGTFGTLGVSALAGAAYLWIYHPEKITAFKNSILAPGFTKLSDFAKSFYIGKK